MKTYNIVFIIKYNIKYNEMFIQQPYFYIDTKVHRENNSKNCLINY